MAYWIQKTSDNHNVSEYKLFYCDYASDIADLPRFGIPGKEQKDDSIASKPCSYGSECICLQNSCNYVLGKDTNQWQLLNNIGNSGSGNSGNTGGNGTIDEKDIATNEDVDNVLDSVFKDK